KFQSAPPPEDVPADGPGILAFAYLDIAIPYTFQFNHHEDGLKFRDSLGKETKVQAFGIREEDKSLGIHSYRGQVQVLFRQNEEFAIDLSRSTTPYQVILARMQRKDTLRATLD